MWDNFKNYFFAVQVALRKTNGITVDEGMNHTELVNMVSEGVTQAIETHKPPGTINNVQDNQQRLDLQQKLAEMKTLVNLRTDNQVLQVSKAHPLAIPFQDVTNTTNHYQPYFAPAPTFYQPYQGGSNQQG